MNKPVTKKEIKSLRVGESIVPYFPTREQRRRLNKLPKGNNRKITKARKLTHIIHSNGKKIQLLKVFR